MEKPNKPKACNDCYYGHMQFIQGQITQSLHCMRNPPQIIAVGQSIMSMAPPVLPLNWCGEFQQKLPVLASV